MQWDLKFLPHGIIAKARFNRHVSILYPCFVTFYKFELYISGLLEDVERFDTFYDAETRALEVLEC